MGGSVDATGKWIAEHGFDLLTAAGLGVKLSPARAFSTTEGRRERSVEIVPSEPHPIRGFAAIVGYPNPYIDLPVLTPLPQKRADAPDDTLNRNYVNMLTSDVVVALSGSQGTPEEIWLAERFAKPLICIGPAEDFDGVPPETRIVVEPTAAYEFVLATTSEVDKALTPKS
ncbi:DNA-binding protein [Paraburkholderia sacchari]|uniref:SLOG cluster 4 domain-containing protein n=1 Tax=Paraburkholderia sacchari TaxID=159450 RepID=UPI001F3ECCE1|nr:DNA-binding protein [Paraburkholderia sacchari]